MANIARGAARIISSARSPLKAPEFSGPGLEHPGDDVPESFIETWGVGWGEGVGGGAVTVGVGRGVTVGSSVNVGCNVGWMVGVGIGVGVCVEGGVGEGVTVGSKARNDSLSSGLGKGSRPLETLHSVSRPY